MADNCKPMLEPSSPMIVLIQRSRFVGTEEGILELNVNIQDRKTFPKISVR